MEVNRTQAADIFGVALTTIDDWRRRGCPSEKVGRAVVMDTKKVFKWLMTDGEELDLQQERAKLAKKQTEKTSLQVDQLKGVLVDAEEVKETWSKYISSCRAKLLALPTKLAGEVITVKTLTEAQDVIKMHVNEALTELANE